jgi:hypothetical protein
MYIVMYLSPQLYLRLFPYLKSLFCKSSAVNPNEEFGMADGPRISLVFQMEPNTNCKSRVYFFFGFTFLTFHLVGVMTTSKRYGHNLLYGVCRSEMLIWTNST